MLPATASVLLFSTVLKSYLALCVFSFCLASEDTQLPRLPPTLGEIALTIPAGTVSHQQQVLFQDCGFPLGWSFIPFMGFCSVSLPLG